MGGDVVVKQRRGGRDWKREDERMRGARKDDRKSSYYSGRRMGDGCELPHGALGVWKSGQIGLVLKPPRVRLESCQS